MNQERILPLRMPADAPRSNRLASAFDRPDADPLGPRRVLTQALHDLFGTKDVQDAVTASYVWLADQMGHIALGLISTLVYCWAFSSAWSAWICSTCDRLALWRVFGLIAGSIFLFGYWISKELTDYRESKSRAGKTFPFNSSDVWWNVKTALFYIACGSVFAVTAFLGPYFLIVAVVVLGGLGLRIGYWWLRHKLAFQQAGLPYLYRLANFRSQVRDGAPRAIEDLANLRNAAVSFFRVCFAEDPIVTNEPAIRHILLTGPLGAGKTSLAVGIATEFAFALGIGRYLTAAKLVQSIADPEERHGDRLVLDDGQVRWPMRRCNLVVIDDVDAGVTGTDGERLHLVRPADFETAIRAQDPEALHWLGSRRSVWVIGDASLAKQWMSTIAHLLKIGEPDIMQVDLTPPEAAAPAEIPASKLRRNAGYIAAAIGVLSLAASLLWWDGEERWGHFVRLSPEQAFADGSFGLELAPLKYILVASKLSGPALELPGGPPWPRRFGLLSRTNATTRMCVADAPRNLPVGFSVSNRLPGSATPVPVQFVGLSCAACHAARLGRSGVVLGPGTQTADVIGFTDAFLSATIDPGQSRSGGLTAEKILAAYDAQHCPGESGGIAGWVNHQIESVIIDQWLAGLRAQSRVNFSKYDLPFHGTELGEPANIPTGPSRTRPFRSVVRNTLDLPGADSRAYSKVPLAAAQISKPWSQFDGSVGNSVVRSLIAVFTSGASISALNEPQIADNVRQAAIYTLHLGTSPRLPSLRESFPEVAPPSPEIVERGRSIYDQSCASCHGRPAADGWAMPAGAPVPSITKLAFVGTDPYRINFRYADMLPVALTTLLPERDISKQLDLIDRQRRSAEGVGDLAEADWWMGAASRLEERSREFPAGHRRAFPPGEVVLRNGYLNAPLMFAWMRAPYLHNGSVLSLSALIGLTPRDVRFCRGDAGYDPQAIGLKTVAPVNGKCPAMAPFLFDATLQGNSNSGHQYPVSGSVSRSDLQDLLTYLGTL